MWAHRLALIVVWSLAIAGFAYFHGEQQITLLKIALGTAYFALIATAHRLAKEADIEFKPVPLILLYILTAIGPFVSIWLDRKAGELLAERGGHAGFLHFARA